MTMAVYAGGWLHCMIQKAPRMGSRGDEVALDLVG